MKNVYLITMFITFIISLLLSNNRIRPRKVYKVTVLIVFIILLYISGFRSTSSIGDTMFYSYSYRLFVENPYVNFKGKDYGFSLLVLLLTKISTDPQILIVFTAFITNAFNILTLYKHSNPFELGTFLYFATVVFYVTMNGIRQAMVAAIMFWASRYIIKNDWIKYLVIVIILSRFHSSAIILIPIYFICRKEAWGREFWAVLGISLMLIVAFRPMLSVIVNLLDSTQYNNYGQDMMKNTATVNPIRVLVTAVPLFLAYFVKDKLKSSWPESNIFIFMSLFNFIVMLFGTRYLFFYRLSIYFELYNLVLIPRLLYFYEIRIRTMLYICIIIFYSVFCFYQISLWDDPYKNVLIQYLF